VRIGTSEEFALVREFFQNVAFDDQSVCRVLEMEEMSDLGRVQWEKIAFENLPANLGWCIQVFVRGMSVSQVESQKLCGPEGLSAFFSLGLLRQSKKDPSALVSPVWVYPADGFFLASDRRDDPDGEPYTPAEDVVFPAIYPGTLRFLKLLPETRGEALDLCGGSGIGALHCSRSARSSVTADLTERSALFAGFNARLNDTHVESVCGDLYSPVRARQFDLISAHPPFVPATGPNMVYRDGGETGEEVTRRIVEGLAEFLRPGGTCMILCVARDTEEQGFEQRARDWLGPAAECFDVVFGLEKILPVGEVVDSMRKRGQQIGEAQAQELANRLRSLHTRQFVYGALVLRRHAQPVLRPPLRIQLEPSGCARDFARLLDWRHFASLPGVKDWLAKSRPTLAPQLKLTARHVVQDGELVPAEFVFEIQKGLSAALRPDGWVVPLVARLDGKRSVADVFASAQKAGELPEGFALNDFADLLRGMIERGFLVIDFPKTL
jgi:methylase of polypeptide subunit release factors